MLGDDHELFVLVAVLFFDELEETGVGQLAEDRDLVVDEVFAEGGGGEGGVDEFDADGVLVLVDGSVDLGGHSLPDFSLHVVGGPVVTHLPHSSMP